LICCDGGGLLRSVVGSLIVAAVTLIEAVIVRVVAWVVEVAWIGAHEADDSHAV